MKGECVVSGDQSNPLWIPSSVAKGLEYLSQPHGKNSIILVVIGRIFFVYIGEFIIKELSVWIIVDLNTSQGRQMVLEAINYSVSQYGCSLG